jgi:lipopolysaccharide biosynthesis protein
MKISPFTSYTCIYAHYNHEQKINKYVICFLKALSGIGSKIIFISNSSIDSISKELLISQIPNIEVHCRENKGYDFGAWKWGLENNFISEDTTHLILANDSCMGPLFNLSPMMEYMNNKNADFWGLTDSVQGNWHIQSYFLVLSKKVLDSSAFKNFFQQNFNNLTKKEIIEHGELLLSKTLSNNGFSHSVFIPYEKFETTDSGNLFAKNPTHFFWDRLIQDFGFPFIKKELILYNPDNIETAGLNILKFIQEITPGYEVENITELIESICRPNNLIATDVELSAICHLYYPHTIFSFLIKLSRLKVYETKLIINLSSQLYLYDVFCKLLRNIFPNAIIIHSPPKGRDIGGKLAALDVLLKNQIPGFCTLIIHDKLSPHTPLGSKWGSKLFEITEVENIAKVIAKFQKNKMIGIITFRDFIQNEYNAESNNFGCTSSEILIDLLEKYNFKINNYDFVAGTIFWIRTEILKVFFLRNPPFEIRKTLESGNVLDFKTGTHVHAWERAFSFLANDQGYKISGL